MAKSKATVKTISANEAKLIMTKYHEGDRAQAVDEMVSGMMGFVGHVINKRFSSFKSKYYDDMFQEGAIAIVTAMKVYDPDKSMPTTFFEKHIIHNLSEFVNKVTNKSSQYHSKNMIAVGKALDKFEATHHSPSVAELASETNLSISVVESTLARMEATNEVSFGDPEEIAGMASSIAVSPEKVCIEAENTRVLLQALDTLSDRDRTIVIYLFGFGVERMTSTEIARNSKEIFGLSKNMSVHQVNNAYRKAIKTLKSSDALKRHFSERYDASRRYAESVSLGEDIELDERAAIIEGYSGFDDEDPDITQGAFFFTAAS